ncbi:MAG: hypothetical protein FJY82_06465 [Candidatus Aminicenantes bacterium]|nr:hypothetical protein [Candidatus Aminicenantes bacterium]
MRSVPGSGARAAAASALVFALSAVGAAEDLVKVESRVAPLRLARGEEGKIVLKLTVKPGIVVTAASGVTVELEPNGELVFPKSFFTAADLAVPRVVVEGKECLDFGKPVEIPLTVSPNARRGVHVIRGRVKYYGTSLAEGWCYKSAVKFSATFSTRGPSPRPGA